MKCTSAEAAKLLRKYNEDLTATLNVEERAKSFLASAEEDVESVRPSYDFAETQRQIAKLEKAIRTIKHALNVFNSTHVVPGFHMTIDEMLVYIPQLTKQKEKLADMRDHLPKERASSGYGAKTTIDYRYANYDIAAAKREYDRVADELSRAQTALDIVNTTEQLEIVLE